MKKKIDKSANKIITVINNKGGTGKTTSVINLAAALSALEKKVLVIDLDSQCNLSSSLGVHADKHHIGTLLLNQSKLDEVIVSKDTINVIPSSDKLLDFEIQINNEPGREYLLKEILETVRDNYDYILIDCPPSLGTLSINALVASESYLVPMQAENFAFIGLDKILVIADKVKKRMNSKLNLLGILFVKQSQKTKFSQAVMTSIGNNPKLKDKIFKTIVRQDISLMECSAFGKNIFEYDKNSRGAEDYKALAEELLSTKQ